MNCSHPNTKLFHLCTQCGALVEPAGPVQYFEVFGIKPRFFVDFDKIQKEFYAISRVLHPDRFHGKSNFDSATQWFAVINKALLTLKFPEGRAEYLFSLAHFEPPKAKIGLPPDLASEYFDLQESLEDPSLSISDKNKQMAEFSKKIEIKKLEANSARDQAFKEWEEVGAPLDKLAVPLFERAAREINQRNYLDSMANDLKKNLEK